jgi:flagellar biosynthetic protein FliP
VTPPSIDPSALLHGGSGSGSAGPIGMVVLLTLVTLLPAIVLSCTCFVRFIVVLGFVRTGLGTQSAPPNQVLVGLALFMAVFVSAPVAMQMYDKGGKPYFDGQMSESAAIEAALPPLREFLIKHTSDADLELFLDASGSSRPQAVEDVPMRALIPAFIVSELRMAFKIGLTILLPFLVIDLVAATVLTSLGMVMVPPSIVSLPAKLLIFVMIDGWHVVVESLLRGVRG